MTTSIIKEIGTKSNNDNTIIAYTGPIQAALHCLKSVAIDKYASDESVATKWKKLFQTALAGIIDMGKTGDDETRVDEVTIMLAIGVFIPGDLTSTPSYVFIVVEMVLQAFFTCVLLRVLTEKSIHTISFVLV